MSEDTNPGASRDRPVASRIPSATYRLQLNSQFGFHSALQITDYLHELGISDCYASPILTARPGSPHGYDVCDCTAINPELGSLNDLNAWSDRLQQLGMGLLVDIVPNHMAADPRNPWWRDVLQHGQASNFSAWFDIDWDAPEAGGKVVLPLLEDRYWRVLESGKLRIQFDLGRLVLRYHDLEFPLSANSLTFLREQLLRRHGDSLKTETDRHLLTQITSAAPPHPPHAPLDRAAPELPKDLPPPLKQALDEVNGTPNRPESFELLHHILQLQHYRLVYWRVGNEEVNYRRFFDVSELVALRMEVPEAFAATHATLRRLVEAGQVTGLRIDHPDGLYDPRQYLLRLRAALADAPSTKRPPPAVQASDASPYIVVEKILTEDETLPENWPVAGTTGYDFLNLLNGLFVEPTNADALQQIYTEFVGNPTDVSAQVNAAKRKILEHSMQSDLQFLARLLHQLAARTRYALDFSKTELRRGLCAVVAGFPVYRTYLEEDQLAPTPPETLCIQSAIRLARETTPDLGTDVFSFIEDLLLGRLPADLDESGRRLCRRFVMRFQQLTGPVMAKGLEDTAFYNYYRLISLNEVGGSLGLFGTELAEFHRRNKQRAQSWPHSMLATSTHDTKRGEDVRARLNVLSEMPGQWHEVVLKWQKINADKKALIDGQPAPTANDEYLLYQTLVGAWVMCGDTGTPSNDFRDRVCQYMLKAIREAKSQTSWTDSNPAYEQATVYFVEALLKQGDNSFLDDFMLFHPQIAFYGLFNSLAQVVLKMTAPGVPDFYQGCELWDYHLVDPDNRQPVDYPRRKELLKDLKTSFAEQQQDIPTFLKKLLKNYPTGQIKLYLIWRILELRNKNRRLFESGTYIPLPAKGPKHSHICAFARSDSNATVITVAARLVLTLTKGAQRSALEPEVWQDTLLPIADGKPGDVYRNVLTQQIISPTADGTELPIGETLSLLPVAVLVRERKS